MPAVKVLFKQLEKAAKFCQGSAVARRGSGTRQAFPLQAWKPTGIATASVTWAGADWPQSPSFPTFCSLPRLTKLAGWPPHNGEKASFHAPGRAPTFCRCPFAFLPSTGVFFASLHSTAATSASSCSASLMAARAGGSLVPMAAGLSCCRCCSRAARACTRQGHARQAAVRHHHEDVARPGLPGSSSVWTHTHSTIAALHRHTRQHKALEGGGAGTCLPHVDNLSD